MIRRIINRLRRQDPSPRTPRRLWEQFPQQGRVIKTQSVFCGGGARRGYTRRPLGMVRLQNRAANKRARVARRVNRV